ncbi:gluconate:H+ symporter [Dellaglioa sp. P0083]|uniref:gluconate:H+ symporter n=1 Tax=Dellaglioa kimchii TaxID=3344667 RepID=UPI0038D3B31A
MPLLIVFIGILFLLLLIIKFKLNTFVSLIITSFVVAIGLGMPLDKITTSIENGIGSQLGHLSLVFGFGAMLGKLVADSGGAYRIATTLINRFGRKWIQLAVVLASFIIGIALFFEVGIVLLIPIVFAIATELGISVLYLGIPMAAALSVTHGFLPPHPAPTAIASALNANVGMVLIYGLLLAIPVTLIAGPLFAMVAKKYIPSAFKQKGNLSALGTQKEFKLEDTPSFAMSTLTSLFPVVIMAISTVYDMIVNKGITPKNPNSIDSFFMFVGSPGVAMLLSLLFAIYSMGIARKIPVKDIMASLEVAIKQIAMLLLIIGGGGAFKQVLVDGGVADVISRMFESSSLSPLLLGWLIAALLRISLGSATVAALTAAGLVSGLIAGSGVDPALMVIAIGSGSLIASHVNDAGFWMIKEYFDLTVKETLATWTVLETVVSVSGLGGVMLINLFV